MAGFAGSVDLNFVDIPMAYFAMCDRLSQWRHFCNIAAQNAGSLQLRIPSTGNPR
jgi:hypothetical protein